MYAKGILYLRVALQGSQNKREKGGKAGGQQEYAEHVAKEARAPEESIAAWLVMEDGRSPQGQQSC